MTAPAPKERPILFSGPMVRALLAGAKTQTRRIVKPQPDVKHWQGLQRMSPKDGKARFRIVAPDFPDDERDDILCPYGQPGDRLWVRETWQCIAGTKQAASIVRQPVPPVRGWIEYAATPSEEPPPRWRPSIHMPRWASRILLELTGVRVERLRDITPDDCRAEGGPYDSPLDQLAWYRDLWESINGHGSWLANPWVWCLSFRWETDHEQLPTMR